MQHNSIYSPAALSLSTTVPIGANPPNEPSSIVSTNPVAASSVFGSNSFNPHAMTPESLMIYLNSRLGGLDSQMNDVFDREQKGERVRGELHAVQQLLTNLESGPKSSDVGTIPNFDQFQSELEGHLQTIAQIDPQLAADMRAKLYGDGQIMYDSSGTPDDRFTTSELENTKDYLNIVAKDLDSSSQMDMIALQQLMSTRQTAIQLATNLIAACGESAKSIATNIR